MTPAVGEQSQMLLKVGGEAEADANADAQIIGEMKQFQLTKSLGVPETNGGVARGGDSQVPATRYALYLSGSGIGSGWMRTEI